MQYTRKQVGFTLIELLVVVAIIAILAAILFPLMTKARGSARMSACISNLKQIGSAVQMYRDDNSGYLPQARNIWMAHLPQWNYFNELEPYLKGRKVVNCSSKPIKEILRSLQTLWAVEGGKWKGATYTTPMHQIPKDYINLGSYAEIQWSQGDKLVNPDTVKYLVDYRTPSASQAVIMACVAGTYSWDGWIDPRIPDATWHGTHHLGTACLFADLHVKQVYYKRVGWF